MVNKRDHIEYTRGLAKTNRGNTKMLPKSWLSPFDKSRSPFRVLEANLPNIGILGDICQDIAKFYSRVMAVRTTLIAVDEGAYDDAEAVDVAFILETEVELWENANKLGRYIVGALRRSAGNDQDTRP